MNSFVLAVIKNPPLLLLLLLPCILIFAILISSALPALAQSTHTLRCDVVGDKILDGAVDTSWDADNYLEIKGPVTPGCNVVVRNIEARAVWMNRLTRFESAKLEFRNILLTDFEHYKTVDSYFQRNTAFALPSSMKNCIVIVDNVRPKNPTVDADVLIYLNNMYLNGPVAGAANFSFTNLFMRVKGCSASATPKIAALLWAGKGVAVHDPTLYPFIGNFTVADSMLVVDDIDTCDQVHAWTTDPTFSTALPAHVDTFLFENITVVASQKEAASDNAEMLALGVVNWKHDFMKPSSTTSWVRRKLLLRNLNLTAKTRISRAGSMSLAVVFGNDGKEPGFGETFAVRALTDCTITLNDGLVTHAGSTLKSYFLHVCILAANVGASGFRDLEKYSGYSTTLIVENSHIFVRGGTVLAASAQHKLRNDLAPGWIQLRTIILDNLTTQSRAIEYTDLLLRGCTIQIAAGASVTAEGNLGVSMIETERMFGWPDKGLVVENCTVSCDGSSELKSNKDDVEVSLVSKYFRRTTPGRMGLRVSIHGGSSIVLEGRLRAPARQILVAILLGQVLHWCDGPPCSNVAKCCSVNRNTPPGANDYNFEQTLSAHLADARIVVLDAAAGTNLDVRAFSTFGIRPATGFAGKEWATVTASNIHFELGDLYAEYHLVVSGAGAPHLHVQSKAVIFDFTGITIDVNGVLSSGVSLAVVALFDAVPYMNNYSISSSSIRTADSSSPASAAAGARVVIRDGGSGAKDALFVAIFLYGKEPYRNKGTMIVKDSFLAVSNIAAREHAAAPAIYVAAVLLHVDDPTKTAALNAIQQLSEFRAENVSVTVRDVRCRVCRLAAVRIETYLGTHPGAKRDAFEQFLFHDIRISAQNLSTFSSPGSAGFSVAAVWLTGPPLTSPAYNIDLLEVKRATLTIVGPLDTSSVTIAKKTAVDICAFRIGTIFIREHSTIHSLFVEGVVLDVATEEKQQQETRSTTTLFCSVGVERCAIQAAVFGGAPGDAGESDEHGMGANHTVIRDVALRVPSGVSIEYAGADGLFCMDAVALRGPIGNTASTAGTPTAELNTLRIFNVSATFSAGSSITVDKSSVTVARFAAVAVFHVNRDVDRVTWAMNLRVLLVANCAIAALGRMHVISQSGNAVFGGFVSDAKTDQAARIATLIVHGLSVRREASCFFESSLNCWVWKAALGLSLGSVSFGDIHLAVDNRVTSTPASSQQSGGIFLNGLPRLSLVSLKAFSVHRVAVNVTGAVSDNMQVIGIHMPGKKAPTMDSFLVDGLAPPPSLAELDPEFSSNSDKNQQNQPLPGTWPLSSNEASSSSSSSSSIVYCNISVFGGLCERTTNCSAIVLPLAGIVVADSVTVRGIHIDFRVQTTDDQNHSPCNVMPQSSFLLLLGSLKASQLLLEKSTLRAEIINTAKQSALVPTPMFGALLIQAEHEDVDSFTLQHVAVAINSRPANQDWQSARHLFNAFIFMHPYQFGLPDPSIAFSGKSASTSRALFKDNHLTVRGAFCTVTATIVVVQRLASWRAFEIEDSTVLVHDGGTVLKENIGSATAPFGKAVVRLLQAARNIGQTAPSCAVSLVGRLSITNSRADITGKAAVGVRNTVDTMALDLAVCTPTDGIDVMEALLVAAVNISLGGVGSCAAAVATTVQIRQGDGAAAAGGAAPLFRTGRNIEYVTENCIVAVTDLAASGGIKVAALFTTGMNWRSSSLRKVVFRGVNVNVRNVTFQSKTHLPNVGLVSVPWSMLTLKAGGNNDADGGGWRLASCNVTIEDWRAGPNPAATIFTAFYAFPITALEPGGWRRCESFVVEEVHVRVVLRGSMLPRNVHARVVSLGAGPGLPNGTLSVSDSSVFLSVAPAPGSTVFASNGAFLNSILVHLSRGDDTTPTPYAKPSFAGYRPDVVVHILRCHASLLLLPDAEVATEQQQQQQQQQQQLQRAAKTQEGGEEQQSQRGTVTARLLGFGTPRSLLSELGCAPQTASSSSAAYHRPVISILDSSAAVESATSATPIPVLALQINAAAGTFAGSILVQRTALRLADAGGGPEHSIIVVGSAEQRQPANFSVQLIEFQNAATCPLNASAVANSLDVSPPNRSSNSSSSGGSSTSSECTSIMLSAESNLSGSVIDVRDSTVSPFCSASALVAVPAGGSLGGGGTTELNVAGNDANWQAVVASKSDENGPLQINADLAALLAGVSANIGCNAWSLEADDALRRSGMKVNCKKSWTRSFSLNATRSRNETASKDITPPPTPTFTATHNNFTSTRSDGAAGGGTPSRSLRSASQSSSETDPQRSPTPDQSPTASHKVPRAKKRDFGKMQSVQEATAIIGMVAGAAAVSGFQLSFKVSSLIKVSQCDDNGDGLGGLRHDFALDPLGPDSNPTTLKILSAPPSLETYYGSMIGNVALVAGALLFFFLATVLYACVVGRSVEKTTLTTRVPGILLPLWGALGVGTLAAASSASGFFKAKAELSVGFADVLLMSVALVFGAAPFFLFVWSAWQCHKPSTEEKLIPTNSAGSSSVGGDDDEKEEAGNEQQQSPPSPSSSSSVLASSKARRQHVPSITEEIGKAYGWLVDTWTVWAPSPFVLRVGLLFDPYALVFFGAIDLGASMAISVAGGATAICTTTNCCRFLTIGCLVVAFAHTVLLFLFSPLKVYMARFEVITCTLGNVLTLVCSALAVAVHFTGDDALIDGSVAVGEVALILALLIGGKGILDMVFAGRDWIKEQVVAYEEKKESDRREEEEAEEMLLKKEKADARAARKRKERDERKQQQQQEEKRGRHQNSSLGGPHDDDAEVGEEMKTQRHFDNGSSPGRSSGASRPSAAAAAAAAASDKPQRPIKLSSTTLKEAMAAKEQEEKLQLRRKALATLEKKRLQEMQHQVQRSSPAAGNSTHQGEGENCPSSFLHQFQQQPLQSLFDNQEHNAKNLQDAERMLGIRRPK